MGVTPGEAGGPAEAEAVWVTVHTQCEYQLCESSGGVQLFLFLKANHQEQPHMSKSKL